MNYQADPFYLNLKIIEKSTLGTMNYETEFFLLNPK